MNFINFIVSNHDILLAIVILSAVIIYVVKRGVNGLYDAALYLVTVAEEEWGSNTGQIKFAEVITALKKTYPIISLFIREEVLKDIIEKALEEMKFILAKKQTELEEKSENITQETK